MLFMTMNQYQKNFAMHYCNSYGGFNVLWWVLSAAPANIVKTKCNILQQLKEINAYRECVSFSKVEE